MNVPESVQIGPYSYKIVLETIDTSDFDVPEMDNAEVIGVELLGMVDHSDLQITLDPDQAAMKMRDSLLHETLHGVAQLTDAIDSESEESIVCALCTNLLDTLRRNPAFVAYLMGDSCE